jgi:hypothetical protein
VTSENGQLSIKGELELPVDVRLVKEIFMVDMFCLVIVCWTPMDFVALWQQSLFRVCVYCGVL